MTHIALIFGGPSAEHEVSLVSAKNIFQVLNNTQYDVTLLGLSKKKVWKLVNSNDLLSTSFATPLDLDQIGQIVDLKRTEEGVRLLDLKSGELVSKPIDVAFPIIHGPYGEDGKLQTELNELKLNFVGSDALSCNQAFDKQKTKLILEKGGIPQVPYLTVKSEPISFARLQDTLGLPVFVKPANMGSSIGISKVTNENEYKKALERSL